MALLDIRVLGYPRIYLDEQLVEGFLSNKVVVLLCYLAMNPQTHARERLAALLWGDMPDRKAKSNLRQALHNLSKLTGDHLTITRQTVHFHQDQPHHVDALALKAAIQHHNPDINTLYNAVELYDGEFLEGIHLDTDSELDDWLLTEREQLRLAYLDSLDRLSERYLAHGDWVQAEVTLRKMAAVEPLREKTHRQIMVCLARQQKHTEATRHYEGLQELLARELDIEPAYETTRLYECILAARVRQPAASLAHLGPLYGRESAIQEIESRLLQGQIRLITITGPGGIGKTQLARHLTARNQLYFVNGACYLPLESLSTQEQFTNALCDVLDLSLPANADPVHHLVAFLKKRDLLITLDNFEHLLDSALIISSILEATQGIKFLVTSRERLNLKHEGVFELDGLPIPTLDNWAESSAWQLFENRVRQIKPDYELNDPATFIELCRHVEGMPLALELAAGWLDTYTLDVVVKELNHSLEVLSSPLRDLPPRHRSVQHLFDQTWAHLPPGQQQKLMHLTVFKGGFTDEAARQVAGFSFADMQYFTNRSWIRTLENGRYTFHELIRKYLEDRVRQSDYDLAGIQEKHCTYFADFLYQFEGGRSATPFTIGAMETMKPELENIQIAWERASDQRRLQNIRKMLESYTALLTQQTRYQGLASSLETLLEQVDGHADDVLLARIVNRLARVHYYIDGNRGAAPGYFQRGLGLSQRIEDSVEVGHALHGLAACHMVSDWDECERLLHLSMDAYQQAGDAIQVAMARNTLALVYGFIGKQGDSTALRQQAYATLKQADDSRLLAPLRVLAQDAIRCGDLEQAETLFQQCMETVERVDSLPTEVFVLLGLGDIAFQREQYDDAQDYYIQAWVLSQQSTPTLSALTNLARVAIKQGQFTQAAQYFSQVVRDENNLDWYIAVLSDVVEFFLAKEQLRLAQAVACIVQLHPAASAAWRDKVAAYLEDAGIKRESCDTHPTPSAKIAFIRQHIPDLASALHIPEAFFESRVGEIEDAHEQQD